MILYFQVVITKINNYEKMCNVLKIKTQKFHIIHGTYKLQIHTPKCINN